MSNESPAIILHDSNGNEVGVLLDGSVYRLQVEGIITAALPPGTNILGRVGIDSAETGGLNLEATQQAVQAVLTSIRDTSGIKKILDALPVGNNIIGQVKVTNDPGSKIVTVIDDVTTPANKRFMVEADIKPGASINTVVGNVAATGAVSELLLNGSSEDMVVDGSSTPVIFSYNAEATYDVQLTSLRLVFSAAFFDFIGASFGKGGGALSNGIEVKITANNGDFVSTMAVLKVNEDFLRLLEFSISQSGSTDVMAASVVFGGRILLKSGSSDKVEVTINDNLTAGSRGIYYFTANAYGIQEDPS